MRARTVRVLEAQRTTARLVRAAVLLGTISRARSPAATATTCRKRDVKSASGGNAPAQLAVHPLLHLQKHFIIGFMCNMICSSDSQAKPTMDKTRKGTV